MLFLSSQCLRFILCHNPVLGAMLTCDVLSHETAQSCGSVMCNTHTEKKSLNNKTALCGLSPHLPPSLAWACFYAAARKAGLEGVNVSLPVVVAVVFSWLRSSFWLGLAVLHYWCGLFVWVMLMWIVFDVEVLCVCVCALISSSVYMCLCTVSRKDKSFWPFFFL